jgi:hypothetical protein
MPRRPPPRPSTHDAVLLCMQRWNSLGPGPTLSVSPPARQRSMQHQAETEAQQATDVHSVGATAPQHLAGPHSEPVPMPEPMLGPEPTLEPETVPVPVPVPAPAPEGPVCGAAALEHHTSPADPGSWDMMLNGAVATSSEGRERHGGRGAVGRAVGDDSPAPAAEGWDRQASTTTRAVQSTGMPTPEPQPEQEPQSAYHLAPPPASPAPPFQQVRGSSSGSVDGDGGPSPSTTSEGRRGHELSREEAGGSAKAVPPGEELGIIATFASASTPSREGGASSAEVPALSGGASAPSSSSSSPRGASAADQEGQSAAAAAPATTAQPRDSAVPPPPATAYRHTPRYRTAAESRAAAAAAERSADPWDNDGGGGGGGDDHSASSRSELRPLPAFGAQLRQLCRFRKEATGVECHWGLRCTSAHSEAELALWRKQSQSQSQSPNAPPRAVSSSTISEALRVTPTVRSGRLCPWPLSASLCSAARTPLCCS